MNGSLHVFDLICSYTKSSSDTTKSTGGICDLAACPQLERAPRMHWIPALRRETVSWQRIHDKVALYGWSHLVANKAGRNFKHLVKNCCFIGRSSRS